MYIYFYAHSTIYIFYNLFRTRTSIALHVYMGARVVQLVEALRYKLEGRGFDYRRCHGNFNGHNPSGRTMALGLTQPFTEMSTNKGGRYVGLITVPPSCADYLEIWELQPPGTLRACPGL